MLKVSATIITLDEAAHIADAIASLSWADEVIVVDSGGICSPDISRLNYKKLRRPIWPLDGVNDPYAGVQRP